MLTVITLPVPSLREPSIEVDRAYLDDPENQHFIDDLILTMYEDEGIGIAAPQVAANVRICVIGKEAIPEHSAFHGADLVLVNPEIQKMSRKSGAETEGCLSVAGLVGAVKRLKDISVRALDRHGSPVSFEAHGFFARVVQHELDHLNGTLFVDRATDIRQVESKKPIDMDIIRTFVS